MMLEVGEWYLSVKCYQCDCDVLIFHDLNQGQGSLKGQYVVACPRCKDMQVRDINRYQHREERQPAVCFEILSFGS